MNESAVRLSLWLACVFNLVAAAAFAFPSSWLGQQIGLPQTASLLYTTLIAFFVGLFGIVYGWLARQSRIDQPLLFLGATGKFGAFLIFTALWLGGAASGQVAAASVGDLVFAVLWLSWLRSA